MGRFLLGVFVGGIAVWMWGAELKQLAETKTRDVRAKAADRLRVVESTAVNVLDKTKEQVASTLHAGQDALRPRMD